MRRNRSSLRVAGRRGLSAGGGGPGPAPDERPDPKAVIQAARAAGLQLTTREDIPPFVFLLVFERATRAGQ